MGRRLSHALLHEPAGWGDAPPVLLVHGAHHGAGCWDGWIAALAARGLPAAALDLRGHGALAGEGLSPQTGVLDYASDVADAVRALPRPPVIVGHSLGALVVAAAVGRLDVPAAGLALVTPSPPGNLPGVAAVPEVREGATLPPPKPEAAIARWMGGIDPPPALREAWLAGLCHESPRAMNERYRLRIAVDPARLAGVPLLVIEAGLDDAARHPPGQDAAIATFFGGRHVLMAEANHCLMLGETCEPSAGLLADWIMECCTSR
jgi:pimeloyl-ACP methyl ester carboxylesterase